MTKKSEEEIVRETVLAYKTRPRGLQSSGSCAYFTEEGASCAVGRCLNTRVELVKSLKNSVKASGVYNATVGGPVASLESYLGGNLDKGLRSPYHGHTGIFWQSLQRLHDNSSFWNKNNLGGNDLTEAGKDYISSVFKFNI